MKIVFLYGFSLIREIRLKKYLKKNLCGVEEDMDFRVPSPILWSLISSLTSCVILGCSRISLKLNFLICKIGGIGTDGSDGTVHIAQLGVSYSYHKNREAVVTVLDSSKRQSLVCCGRPQTMSGNKAGRRLVSRPRDVHPAVPRGGVCCEHLQSGAIWKLGFHPRRQFPVEGPHERLECRWPFCAASFSLYNDLCRLGISRMRPEAQPLYFWLKICAINWGKTEEMVCASAVLSLNPSLSACSLCEHVLPALQSYSLQLYTRVLFLDTDTHTWG